MYKFEIGQVVRAEDARLYKVEDTAMLPDGRNIFAISESTGVTPSIPSTINIIFSASLQAILA